jgi:2-polyprenyl-3-methyl-5-hydroxy-6-metoxy-1,4-benzoquinol methylase
MFAAVDSDLYKEEETEKFYDGRYAKKGSFAYMDDWHEEKKQRIVNLIKELDLPERGDALDFGCGTGVLTEVIRKKFSFLKTRGPQEAKSRGGMAQPEKRKQWR